MSTATAWPPLTALPPPEWRACRLCQWGTDVNGERHCTHQACVQPARSQPVELMRRNTGPCGPEAYHLQFPGLVDLRGLGAW